VAEETGLVTELGRWVFAEACRQLAIWQIGVPGAAFIVRINMSPADFKMGDLVSSLNAVCARTTSRQPPVH